MAEAEAAAAKRHGGRRQRQPAQLQWGALAAGWGDESDDATQWSGASASASASASDDGHTTCTTVVGRWSNAWPFVDHNYVRLKLRPGSNHPIVTMKRQMAQRAQQEEERRRSRRRSGTGKRGIVVVRRRRRASTGTTASWAPEVDSNEWFGDTVAMGTAVAAAATRTGTATGTGTGTGAQAHRYGLGDLLPFGSHARLQCDRVIEYGGRAAGGGAYKTGSGHVALGAQWRWGHGRTPPYWEDATQGDRTDSDDDDDSETLRSEIAAGRNAAHYAPVGLMPCFACGTYAQSPADNESVRTMSAPAFAHNDRGCKCDCEHEEATQVDSCAMVRAADGRPAQCRQCPEMQYKYVAFRWPYPAKQVTLSGSFALWHHQYPLAWDRCERLFKTELNLPLGHVEYKFLVDQRWCYDVRMPTADDGFGGKNNVVHNF